MCDYVNSKTARFDKSHVSCGVVEVHHLPDGNPSKTVLAIANHLYHKANPRPASFVIFSDTAKDSTPSRGEVLAGALSKMERQGKLTATGATMNPRTGNVIQLWCFQPSHEEFRAWYTEEVMNRVRDE